MGEILPTCNNIIKCCFAEHELKKPTQEELLGWLQDRSGLTQEYFEKILQVKFDGETIRGLEITFEDSVNCFIAIRQIKNRFVYGKLGKCNIHISCPKGDFKNVILAPNAIRLFAKNNVIDALKDYGVIIDIQKVEWRDVANKINISTGDLCIRILTSKHIPLVLNVGGILTNVKVNRCEVNIDDEILQELWNCCRSGEKIDYFKKCFEYKDRFPGCRLVCKFENDNDLPNQTDVYEWLLRDSRLSEEYLKKILVFKKISDAEYQILFDASINCLLAMKQIAENHEVCNACGVRSTFEIFCSKGKFVNVRVTARNHAGSLSEKDLEAKLNTYGVVTDRKKLNGSFDSDGILVRPFQYKIFKKSELPSQLKINEINAKIEMAECEQDQNEETLIKVWGVRKSCTSSTW